MQKRKNNIRNCPSEFEGKAKVGGKGDKINEFRMNVGSNTK